MRRINETSFSVKFCLIFDYLSKIGKYAPKIKRGQAKRPALLVNMLFPSPLLFFEYVIRLRRRPRLRAETPAQSVSAKAGTSACRHGLCPWGSIFCGRFLVNAHPVLGYLLSLFSSAGQEEESASSLLKEGKRHH